LRDRTWLEQQWDIARLKAGESAAGRIAGVGRNSKSSQLVKRGEIALGRGHAFRRSPESGFARFSPIAHPKRF
jgi:hypothetical protein